MNIRNISAKVAMTTLLPLAVSTVANAQSHNLDSVVPGFSYSKSTSRETWRTVSIISGVILLAGLVDSNSALIIVGGAGLLVSLSATNGNMYRPQARGVELVQMGNVSLGVRPFQQIGSSLDFRGVRPNLTLQAKFKF